MIALDDLTPDATLSQIISSDKEAGTLLASIGLKPQDHKDETLRSVCQQRKWSEVEVLNWVKEHRLSRNIKNKDERYRESDFSLSQWHEYLNSEFYSYNRDLLQEIKSAFPRVHKIHGNQYPWLKDMQWHFNDFSGTVEMYYEFTTKKFYPLTEGLEEKNSQKILHGTIRKLKRCFKIINQDQKRLTRLMETIRRKGNNFENPGLACSTFTILNQNFKMLFSNLLREFKIETEFYLPAVKKELQAN